MTGSCGFHSGTPWRRHRESRLRRLIAAARQYWRRWL